MKRNPLLSVLIRVIFFWFLTILLYFLLFRVAFDYYVSHEMLGKFFFPQQNQIITGSQNKISTTDVIQVIVYRWGILPSYYNGKNLMIIHYVFFIFTLIIYIIWGLKKLEYFGTI